MIPFRCGALILSVVAMTACGQAAGPAEDPQEAPGAPTPTPWPNVSRHVPHVYPKGVPGCWKRVDDVRPFLCDDIRFRQLMIDMAQARTRPRRIDPKSMFGPAVRRRDEERDRRVEALREWVPCLAEALKSPDPCRQLAACRLLETAGDPRAVPALLELLANGDPVGEAAICARRTLANTFEEPRVIPHVVSAIRDPDIPLQDWYPGLSTGLSDERLLEALLDELRGTSDGAIRRRLAAYIATQASAAPQNPRLRKLAPEILASASPSTVERLAKNLCRESPCDWLKSCYVEHAATRGVESTHAARLLAEDPQGRLDTAFLEKLYSLASGESSRAGLAHLLIKSCRPGGDTARSSGTITSCLAGLENDVRRTARLHSEITRVISAACTDVEHPVQRTACWKSLAPLFRDNRPLWSWILLHQASAILDQQDGSLDDVERILRTIGGADWEYPLGSRYDRVKNELDRRRWEVRNRSITSRISIDMPQRIPGSNRWRVVLHGPPTLLAPLTESTVTALLQLATEANGEEYRAASVEVIERKGTSLSLSIVVHPLPPIPAGPHRLTAVSLVFVGNPHQGQRVALSWP